MPYCRRCGTKLEENARFCYNCGTSRVTRAPSTPARPAVSLRKDPLVVAGIVSIAILVTAAIITAIIAVPIGSVNFNQTFQDNHPNINTLNLNFQADSAQVDIIPLNVTDKNILIIVSAVGSKSIYSSKNNSIQVTFDNQTNNNQLTINSRIMNTGGSFTRNFAVTCTIYVNPTLRLNLNVTTQNGAISLAAEKSTTFQSVNLEARAGRVQATLQNATIGGNFSLETDAGSLYFGMSQSKVSENSTVNLQSNAGSVNMDVTQTKTLQGNLQINAKTDLGSIDENLQIDGDVAARIISQTSLGSVHVNKNHFSGDQSPIQSNNYPGKSNIEINNRTNLGSIVIDANYQSSVAPSTRN